MVNIDVDRLTDAVCTNDKLMEEIYSGNYKTVKNVMDIVLPSFNDKKIINYSQNIHNMHTATFYPEKREIVINPMLLETYLERNFENYKDKVNDYEREYLISLLLIQCLTHESMHSRQYLMGNKEISYPNKFISSAYRLLYEFLEKNDFKTFKEQEEYLRLLSLYRDSEKFLLLERNAQIESMNIICEIAKRRNNMNIYNIFDRLRRSYVACGYFDDTKGSIYETLHLLGMNEEYNKIYEPDDFTEARRIRYGLEIKESTRQKVLK